MSEEKNLSTKAKKYGITSIQSKKIVYEDANNIILNTPNKNEMEENPYYDQNTIIDVIDGVEINKNNDNKLEKQDIDEFDDFYSNDLYKDSMETINEIEKLKENFEKIKLSNFPIGVKIRLTESVR